MSHIPPREDFLSSFFTGASSVPHDAANADSHTSSETQGSNPPEDEVNKTVSVRSSSDLSDPPATPPAKTKSAPVPSGRSTRSTTAKIAKKGLKVVDTLSPTPAGKNNTARAAASSSSKGGNSNALNSFFQTDTRGKVLVTSAVSSQPSPSIPRTSSQHTFALGDQLPDTQSHLIVQPAAASTPHLSNMPPLSTSLPVTFVPPSTTSTTASGGASGTPSMAAAPLNFNLLESTFPGITEYLARMHGSFPMPSVLDSTLTASVVDHAAAGSSALTMSPLGPRVAEASQSLVLNSVDKGKRKRVPSDDLADDDNSSTPPPPFKTMDTRDSPPPPSKYIDNVSFSTLPLPVLPINCEVTPNFIKYIPASQLAVFQALPPLVQGTWRSWSKEKAVNYTYEQLRSEVTMENTNGQLLISSLQAVMFQSFVNRSRASPRCVLAVRPVTGLRPRYTICVAELNAVATMTTVVRVSTSFLNVGQPAGGGVREKGITCMIPRGESERLASFTCMVLQKPEFAVQIRQGIVTFSTNREVKEPSDDEQDDNPCFATASTRAPSSVGLVGRDQLDFTDTVPIYDGRSISWSYEQCMSHLEELPRFPQPEVPHDSMAVVGYNTVSL
ncbi:hypothetical protein MIND_01004700 [Mycena indigotica]|uniref:Uncharacterized protein n=1 Tax=Mycena indigotica TaxID=2126181 RepID=A0A8H6VUR8_9AGAR|nr:uncharacterized protein MIND_01004700 [Mycena indigotica]KAF7294677.1 hypothetical protein MIND_01004700 [Mycena indigotica]